MKRTKYVTSHVCPLSCRIVFLPIDYAVQIFHDAMRTGHHTCYLRPDTRLPLMYIHDCLRSIVEFLDVPDELLRHRTYNIQSTSFTPAELADEIQKVIPEFEISYSPDTRQQIGRCGPVWASLGQSGLQRWQHWFSYNVIGLVHGEIKIHALFVQNKLKHGCRVLFTQD